MIQNNKVNEMEILDVLMEKVSHFALQEFLLKSKKYSRKL